MTSSSSSKPPPPTERAAEIIDKLPSHPSLITKTGTAILGSGLLATAISQELYVFNEETVIAVGYFILFAYIAKVRRFLSTALPDLPYAGPRSGNEISINHTSLPLGRSLRRKIC